MNFLDHHDQQVTADMLPCAETDPEMFHSTDAKDEAFAKGVCSTCFLQVSCRQRAREERRWGTWGGETEAERAEAGYAPKY
ncbi:WhiB family transcriptional regulator [Kitasatospora sp. NPDC088783]|uniref:WhiB family transcriptional regulator n=1 Tax=Kitasatospora sp. NPDC088783 TaxID=3364077 RepID=UPI0037F46539